MTSEIADRCVYFHRRPDTGDVFYVGIGSKARPRTFANRNPKWKSIVAKYGSPDVEIVSTGLTLSEAAEIEKAWIGHFGLENLANLTPGGDGVLGSKHTEEHKRKISEAGRGRKHSAETRKKIADAHTGEKHYNYGKTLSDEHKRSLSDALTGRVVSDETRQKIAASKMGQSPTPETRRKISEANTGRTHSEKTRLNMSIAHKGRVHSEETRKKISESKSGSGHPKFNSTIYSFTHSAHGTVHCTQHHLRTTYGLFSSAVSAVANGKVPSTRGWRLLVPANGNSLDDQKDASQCPS